MDKNHRKMRRIIAFAASLVLSAGLLTAAQPDKVVQKIIELGLPVVLLLLIIIVFFVSGLAGRLQAFFNLVNMDFMG